MPLEIEVKFYLGPEETAGREILSHIEAMGGRSGGKVFERNIRFEDSGHSLLKRKSLLRLRQDQGTRLTFKCESAKTTDRDRNNFKIFEELEVDVSDFSTMVRILGALGYHPAQVYEKWRKTIAVGDSHLCMDTMPFGEFLEIEGDRDEIPELAVRIGLDWDRRILETYLGIFAQLKQALALPFSDVTFDHFKTLPGGLTLKDLTPYIRRHELGRRVE